MIDDIHSYRGSLMIQRLLSRFRGRPSAVVLLSSGMLAGSLLAAPAIGLTAVTPAADQVRAASCWATAFHPIQSGVTYVIGDSQALYFTGGGSTLFRCDLDLPQRAVVTALKVTEIDHTYTGGMGECSLLRFNLAATSASTKLAMATVPETGFPDMPGTIQQSDTTISHATIDHQKYAYAVECDLNGSGYQAGLYGASVTYTISAANG
jgi:hypothetical protein